MQAVYAWYCTDYHPAQTFEYNLEEFAEDIRAHERQKGDKGDLRLLTDLFYATIERREEFDDLIQRKAENWELDRIALLDRILMQMGICEMLLFAEIPIKVTINEYLEIAKKFSTPKSSKFINGILDSLYIEMKDGGDIQKKGRGLIEESIPRGRPQPNRGGFDGPPPPASGKSISLPSKKKRKRVVKTINPRPILKKDSEKEDEIIIPGFSTENAPKFGISTPPSGAESAPSQEAQPTLDQEPEIEENDISSEE
ncbi:UNVERIFIED_CONTAM: hypothetical protein GTU68_033229 [Idotea baltica]|nr:hypothetical protein [Idotea baltica]